MNYNFVTLGETMLRLTPPGQQLIEQANTLEIYVGGSESNVAVGLARLGWRVAWVSRLTDNALGRKVAMTIRAQGVDVSHVVWTDQNRIGTYYVEEGASPRGSTVIYDRVGSAMSYMQPHEIPQGLFQSEGIFFVSGITLAISETAAQTAAAAVHLAKSAGWRICFDVNYRRKLWEPSIAATACSSLIEQSDIVFIAQRDAVTLYSAPTDPDEALAYMAAHFPNRVLILTLGTEGAICHSPISGVNRCAAFPAQGRGRIGGGDAFVAGFLSAYIDTAQVDDALAWGAAAAAYKYTLPGDMPLLDRQQVQEIVNYGDRGSIRR